MPNAAFNIKVTSLREILLSLSTSTAVNALPSGVASIPSAILSAVVAYF